MRLNTTVGNYEHLENALKDHSVYIVGSGPSLIGYDYGRLKGKTVLAINIQGLEANKQYLEYISESRLQMR